MNIIWVDQYIERLISNSPFKNLLVARSGITTKEILLKILMVLNKPINVKQHIIEEHVENQLDDYYLTEISKELKKVNDIYFAYLM